MTITKYSPYTSLDLLFKDFFNDDLFWPLTSQRKISYPTDVLRKENGDIEFNIAAIDLDKDDIEIKIQDGDTLSVSYNKSDKVEKNYIYNGITHKSFQQMWKIPSNYDLERLEAKLEKGLLKITIPYDVSKKPKTIEIKDIR